MERPSDDFNLNQSVQLELAPWNGKRIFGSRNPDRTHPVTTFLALKSSGNCWSFLD